MRNQQGVLHRVTKKLRLGLFAFGLILIHGSTFGAAPASVGSIPLIADLVGNDWSAYPGLEVSGYNTAGDGGGGYFARRGTSCQPNDGTVFKDHAGNCFVRRDAVTKLFRVEWFGAYGDGQQSGSGRADGTSLFTDSKADCVAAANAGKNHIVMIPPPGTRYLQVSTTFTCKSATSFALASAPDWSAKDVSYYIGHDDGVAFSRALAAANADGTLEVDAPVYLIASLPAGLGTVHANIVGIGAAPPTILLAGLSSTSDGMTLWGWNQGYYQNFTVNCAFGGQDCVDWASAIAGTSLKNISVFYGQRDCLAVDGAGGLENATADLVHIDHCGRHGLMINQTGQGYFNAIVLSSFNIRGLSQREEGGTCIYGARTNQSLPVLVQNLECDAQYGIHGQSVFRPLANAIYFNSASWVWDFETLTVENTGEARQVCTGPCASIAVNFNNNTHLLSNMRAVYGNSYWATMNQAIGPVVASGVLQVGAGESVTLFRAEKQSHISGLLTIINDRPGNTSQEVWQINAISATPQYSKVGSTATYGSGASFTVSASSKDAVTAVSVQNTSGSPTLLTYSLVGNAPVTANTN